MSFERAIESRLRAWPGIAATGVSVGWTRRLPSLPFLALQIVADPRPQHMRGNQIRSTTLQLDAWSPDFVVTGAIGEAAIAALAGPFQSEGVSVQRGFAVAVRHGSELEQATREAKRGELYRKSIDITLWHNG